MPALRSHIFVRILVFHFSGYKSQNWKYDRCNKLSNVTNYRLSPMSCLLRSSRKSLDSKSLYYSAWLRASSQLMAFAVSGTGIQSPDRLSRRPKRKDQHWGKGSGRQWTRERWLGVIAAPVPTQCPTHKTAPLTQLKGSHSLGSATLRPVGP